MTDAHQTPLGECCDDLRTALLEVEESNFRVEDNGVLYLTVGSVETDEGAGYLDQAVLFCPFCGQQLQTREDIERASRE